MPIAARPRHYSLRLAAMPRLSRQRQLPLPRLLPMAALRHAFFDYAARWYVFCCCRFAAAAFGAYAPSYAIIQRRLLRRLGFEVMLFR